MRDPVSTLPRSGRGTWDEFSDSAGSKGGQRMARNPTPRRRRLAGKRRPGGDAGDTLREIGRPLFAQPAPTEDPTVFHVKHASDGEAYKEIDQLNREHKIHPLPFPAPRGGVEPRLTLQQVLGGNPVANQA